MLEVNRLEKNVPSNEWLSMENDNLYLFKGCSKIYFFHHMSETEVQNGHDHLLFSIYQSVSSEHCEHDLSLRSEFWILIMLQQIVSIDESKIPGDTDIWMKQLSIDALVLVDSLLLFRCFAYFLWLNIVISLSVHLEWTQLCWKYRC